MELNKIILDITQNEFDGITSKKNFGNDVIIGEVGEKLFKQYLTEYKGLSFIRKSEDRKDLKKWDLEFLFKDKVVKYEIKTDVFIYPGKWIKPNGWNKEIWVKGKDTGNIFIEFHSRGVESGISSTTSDVWVNIFFHLNEIWIIMVDELKKLIEQNKFKIAEESGDVNSHTKGYLIPREKFKEYFKVVKYEMVVN